MFQKATVNFEQGEYASAISGFTKLISSKPSSGLVPYGLEKRAICYVNQGEYSKAESDYKRILERYPKYPKAEGALLGLQEVLNQQGKSSEFATTFG